MDSRTPLKMLLDLDSRHDELLDRLADLDKQVSNVLAQCQAPATRMSPLPSEELRLDPGGPPLASPGIVEALVAAKPTLDGVL